MSLLKNKLNVLMLIAVLTSALASCSNDKVAVLLPAQPLQVKQTNDAMGGRNYVLCDNCIHPNNIDITTGLKANR